MVSAGWAIAEGKTKTIFPYHDAESDVELVAIQSKDDITAGNGARHDIIPGKGVWATTTTSNVFRLLKTSMVPVAFVDSIPDSNQFIAPRCTMIPYEVVVRRYGAGSYVDRNGAESEGRYFSDLIGEFYLKTSGKRWKEWTLLVDDPLVAFSKGFAYLYSPSEPIEGQQPMLTLSEYPCMAELERTEIIAMAKQAFLKIEQEWRCLGGKLVDCKFEFGFDSKNHLLLADVVDNDSWRLLYHGEPVSKQIYRDGASLEVVAEKYKLVADLTKQFSDWS